MTLTPLPLFNASKSDRALIKKIADRAQSINANYDSITAQMDLECVHCNGTPLDLQKLLDSDDPTFRHDVFGIANNIDRDSGTLELFLPRCAKH